MLRGRWRLFAVAVALLVLTGCTAGTAHRSQDTGTARPSGPVPSGPVSSGPSAPPTRAAAPSPAQPAPSWVAAENALPGTPGWAITTPAAGDAVAGYAGTASALPGTGVPLFVSTTSPGFTVHAFRVGWYGGVGARQVWASATVPGARQPSATTSGPTRTASAPWSASLTVPTAGWPAGDYLLRLDASAGPQSWVPLTLRTQHNAGRVVLDNAVTTWQAYNRWGGRSLYVGPGGVADRSYAVSFDRPYDRFDGAGLFWVDELPAVRLAESLGLDLGYTTSPDLDADPAVLDGAQGLVSMGHDEYWSAAMRTAVTAARDRGVDLAFLGANAVYRHIRYGATATGPDRLETDYKEPGLDPLSGHDDADVTADWPSGPRPRPESDLTGTMYECNPVLVPMVVTDPGSWLFAGTGAGAGEALPDVVGSEYDRVDPALPTPRPIEVLAHSPVTCDGVHSYADMAWYTTPSGAGVLDIGTNMWVRALDHGAGTGAANDRNTAVATQVTTNLLRAFAAGPAGLAHPATDDLAAVGAFAGNPIHLHHPLW